MPTPVAEPNPFEQLLSAGVADRAGIPSSTSGNDTFWTAVSIGTRFEEFEDESEIATPKRGTCTALIVHKS